MRKLEITWRPSHIASISPKKADMSLQVIDRKLLNLAQLEFPILQEPFAALGSRLGLNEDEVLKRLHYLKEMRIIRSIGPTFDATRLGYHSTLVAMHLEEKLVEDAADLINHNAGVSHNYLRDNYFNLWFTLSATKDTNLDATAAKLGEDVGAEITLSLPSLQVFKIMVYFDMLNEVDVPQTSESTYTPVKEAGDLADTDKELVRELQQGLLLEKRPFDRVAATLGLEVNQLLERIASLKKNGIIRRYGARLDHRRAGFVANAMSCWLVASPRIDQVGHIIARHRQVSHCYERKTAPQWPYNIYAMIHGHTEEECSTIASKLSQDTGIEGYVLLYSTKEYMKRSPRYFAG